MQLEEDLKTNTVKRGYDKIAKNYQEWRQRFSNFSQFKEFSKLLQKNAKVLDVGCGTGIPVAKFLVEKGYDLTGIDISPEMVNLAEKNVPKGKFIRMDMTKMNFKRDAFDGVVAAYSLIHVPKEKHENLIKKVATILKTNGIFIFSVGIKEEEFHSKFLEAEMFWSYYSPQKYLGLLKQEGFEILSEIILKGDGEYPDCWILTKKVVDSY